MVYASVQENSDTVSMLSMSTWWWKLSDIVTQHIGRYDWGKGLFVINIFLLDVALLWRNGPFSQQYVLGHLPSASMGPYTGWDLRSAAGQCGLKHCCSQWNPTSLFAPALNSSSHFLLSLRWVSRGFNCHRRCLRMRTNVLQTSLVRFAGGGSYSICSSLSF